MRIIYHLLVVIFILLCAACSSESEDADNYTSLSRYTDPGKMAFMLEEMPRNVLEICKIAEQQMVHHNLLVYHNVPYRQNQGIPPRMSRLLTMLKERNPHNLYEEREVVDRIVSSCIVECHFLAGLLRHKGIPARTRAGYFRDILANPEHFSDFWEKTFRGRRVMGNLLASDPVAWKKWVDSFTGKQIQDNHYIEHWICEYWDEEMNKWRILDANTTFLKASCGLDVGYLLPRKHYEYAFEAWKKMRSDKNFNPDQYREDDQNGQFHIRKSMLWDYFSLLNHDIAGFENPGGDARKRIYKPFNELSSVEIEELDQLAELLSKNPSKKELIDFYQKSTTLKLKDVEKDPYSFIFKKKV